MRCEWVKCNNQATHHEVYWGEVRDLCEEHYELIGKDEDGYPTVNGQ